MLFVPKLNARCHLCAHQPAVATTPPSSRLKVYIAFESGRDRTVSTKFLISIPHHAWRRMWLCLVRVEARWDPRDRRSERPSRAILYWAAASETASISSIRVGRKKIKSVGRPTCGNKLPVGGEAAGNEGMDGRCIGSTVPLHKLLDGGSDITSLHIDSANWRRCCAEKAWESHHSPVGHRRAQPIIWNLQLNTEVAAQERLS